MILTFLALTVFKLSLQHGCELSIEIDDWIATDRQCNCVRISGLGSRRHCLHHIGNNVLEH